MRILLALVLVLGLTAAEMADACPDTSAVAVYGPPEILG